MFQWTINAVIYQNSTVIATSAVVFSFLTGFITITKFRKQIVMRKILYIFLFKKKKKKKLFCRLSLLDNTFFKKLFNYLIYILTARINKNVLYINACNIVMKKICPFFSFLNANVFRIIFHVFLLCGVQVVKHCLRDIIIRTTRGNNP